MSIEAGTKLDKFQDIVEPFQAAGSSAVIYIIVFCVIAVGVVVSLRMRRTKLLRTIGALFEECKRGMHPPRTVLSQISSLIEKASVNTDNVNSDFLRQLEVLKFSRYEPGVQELESLIELLQVTKSS